MVQSRNVTVTVKVDYLEFTVSGADSPEIVYDLIGLRFDDMQFNDFSQLQTYHESYLARGLSISAHVKFQEIDGEANYDEIEAVRVVMSGHGVDTYAKARFYDGYSWVDLFNSFLELDKRVKINRIDLATDCVNGNLPEVKKLRDVYREGRRIFSKARNYKYIESGDLLESDDSRIGATLYLGKGDQVLRIYNKLAEQKAQGQYIDSEIQQWIRFELQLRNKKADEAINLIAEVESIQQATKSILAGHYRFLYPKDAKEARTSKKSAWSFRAVKWWEQIIAGVAISVLAVTKPSVTIASKRNFISHQAQPSILQLALVDEYLAIEGGYNFQAVDYNNFKDALEKYDKFLSDGSQQNLRKYERFCETTKAMIVEQEPVVNYFHQAHIVDWIDRRIKEYIQEMNDVKLKEDILWQRLKN